MHETATQPEKTQAEIPYSLLEYTAVFKKPILEAWAAPAFLISAVLTALEPFGFNIDGVEIKSNPEKLSDHTITFRRKPPGVLTFTLGIGKLVIVAENLDWSGTEQFIAGAEAGLNAAMQQSKAEIATQHLVLAVHIQLKNKPRQQVTTPLLSMAALRLMDGNVIFPGIILLREKASIIIDASAAFANGLFVRIIREHPGGTAFEQLAEVLRADEEHLFDTLGLEGIL